MYTILKTDCFQLWFLFKNYLHTSTAEKQKIKNDKNKKSGIFALSYQLQITHTVYYTKHKKKIINSINLNNLYPENKIYLKMLILKSWS